jgi:hypothetical protein
MRLDPAELRAAAVEETGEQDFGAAGPTSNVGKDAGHFRRLLEAKGLADSPMAKAAMTAADAIATFARSKS